MGFFPKERDLTQPPDRIELVVDGSFFREKAQGFQIRLDQFLGAHFDWRSRNSIQGLVRDGYVYVDAVTPDQPNGSGQTKQEKRPGKRLLQGTRVVVVIPEELRLPAFDGDASSLSILYEDDDVIAVDKPAMVAVHPSGRHHADTLIQRVHAHFQEEIKARGEAPRLGHRLDRETSGVLLIGKGVLAHRELRRQFEEHLVDKTYLAVVWGTPVERQGSIRFPIGPASMSPIRLKMAVRADGAQARTDYQVLEQLERHALVECRLFTGRQHQIRLHLAAIGHAIVGDKLYGPDEQLFIRSAEDRLSASDHAELELPRQALHHHEVSFTSPATGQRITVRSPLASDLKAFLGSY